MNKIPILAMLLAAAAVTLAANSVVAQATSALVINEIAWAGTEASSADEWFELVNASDTQADTTGYTLVFSRTTGITSTISLPAVTVGAWGIALFERTDDNATSWPAAGTFSGGIPNSDVAWVELRAANGETIDRIDNPGGQWPAGTTAPRASMQWMPPGGWRTSNASLGVTDADGNPILGTPGQDNWISSDPVTCTELPPAWDLNLTMDYVDDEWIPTVTSDVQVYGVITNTLVEGNARIEFTWQSPLWQVSVIEIDAGMSSECNDALVNLADVYENLANGWPVGFPAYDEHELNGYTSDFFKTVRQFQVSGVYRLYLPVASK